MILEYGAVGDHLLVNYPTAQFRGIDLLVIVLFVATVGVALLVVRRYPERANAVAQARKADAGGMTRSDHLVDRLSRAGMVIAILSPSFRGGSYLILVVLLAAFSWMIAARIVRGLTMSLREREFVKAAQFMGVPPWTIIFRHILPNMSSLLIIDATITIGAAILAETGLSFFGFGIQAPDVSLGTLIGAGTDSALTFPWLFFFAAGFLVAAVLAVNLVGDGLRDALDSSSGQAPRGRRARRAARKKVAT